MIVKDVAKVSKVTVRTLHYYDGIGLLTPNSATDAGYRLYDEGDLERLQQILFFKELGFKLKDIAGIIDSPNFERKEALKKQKHLLKLKQKRIDGLVRLIDDILKGENTMSFEEFDSSEIQEHMKKHEKEAREKWGDTLEYKQSMKKTSKYTDADWARIKKESHEIYDVFVGLMENGGTKEENDRAVKKWQQHITDNYYDASDETMLGLADMYVSDSRFKKNIDKFQEGLAEYMSDAIKQCFKKY